LQLQLSFCRGATAIRRQWFHDLALIVTPHRTRDME
jgi:hypothetical protein